MNVFISAIIGAIQAHYKDNLLQILAGLPVLLVQGILVLFSDEQQIFLDALNALLADLKAKKDWEVALTDAYNTFYNEETGEGHKVAMATLEAIAGLVKGL